jgi:ubiquinone/menaquinone biosynthesis C-methylase UbiE
MPIDALAFKRWRYTLYAPFYDLLPGFARERARSIELLGLRPGERVLVVGVGTGMDLPLLPRDVSVLATDLTPAMLARARRRAGPRVELRVMDGQRLDLPDASFDAVVLHQILAVAPDPARLLREAARALRPGGRVAIFDKFLDDGPDAAPWRRLLRRAADTVFTTSKESLEELLRRSAPPLGLEHQERAAGRGPFRIVLLRRPGA